jgi:hypothetical protein
MQVDSDYIPCLKVYSNQTVNYAKYIGAKRERKPPEVHVTKIPLSSQSVRKIRKVIDFMADTAVWKKVPCYDVHCDKAKHSVGRVHFHWFRLGFLTLTLPAFQLFDHARFDCYMLNQGVISQNAFHLKSYDDKEVKEAFENDDQSFFDNFDSDFKITDDRMKSFCLNHFLTVLREKYNVSKYLWKAEAQRNGNIHFHIVIDRFIHWKVLQYVWNRVLSKTTLIDDFEKKHGHRNPPTIEVHSVKKVQSIRKYLTEYLAKSEDRKRKIEGRRWACSEELSKYDGVEVQLTGVKLLEFEKLWSLPRQYKWYTDYFCVYKLSIGQLSQVLEGTKILDEYVNSYFKIYGSQTFNN